MHLPDAKVLIFAKAPVQGEVKTRLAEKLGHVQACHIYQQLLHQTFETAMSCGLSQVICYTNDMEHQFFDSWKERGIRFYSQHGKDLGERMFNAFSEQMVEKVSPVLLIGSDCPVLTSRHLLESLRLLKEGNDTVLIPSEDGGYVLVGLNKLLPDMFQSIEWSTPAVLRQTLKQLKRVNAHYALLPALWDIDTETDYNRWTN